MCSVCGRRGAFYLRRSSGQRLCVKCLEQAIEAAVKRSIRGINVFRPGMRVGVYIASLDPRAGLALSAVMGSLERRYGGEAAALKPPYVSLDSSAVELLESRGVKVVEAGRRLNGSFHAASLLRLERALAVEAASELGLRVAMLPVTRTMISMIGVEAMMSGRLEYMWDLSVGWVEVRGVTAVYGLRTIESEAVAAYYYALGVNVESQVEPVYRFKRVYTSIAYSGRPELEHSSEASIELLASTIEVGGGCRLCGAPAGSLGVCSDCRILEGL